MRPNSQGSYLFATSLQIFNTHFNSKFHSWVSGRENPKGGLNVTRMVRYILKPIGSGKRYLKPFFIDTERNESFTLGRNIETGLDKVCPNSYHVSRNHVAIKIHDGVVYVDPIARQDNVVTLDGLACPRGEQMLPVNSTLSMLGSISWFNYTLVLEDQFYLDDISEPETATVVGAKRPVVDLADDAEEGPTGKKIKPPQRVDSIDMTKQNDRIEEIVVLDGSDAKGSSSQENKTTGVNMENLLRQYECEICYDTLASVCTLIPCGDCFCFTCIQGWSAKKNICPHCQQPFDLNMTVPNKIMDNAIREIVKTDAEALKKWEDRVDEGNQARKLFSAPAAAPVAPKSSLMTLPTPPIPMIPMMNIPVSAPTRRPGVSHQAGGRRVQQQGGGVIDLTL